MSRPLYKLGSHAMLYTAPTSIKFLHANKCHGEQVEGTCGRGDWFGIVASGYAANMVRQELKTWAVLRWMQTTEMFQPLRAQLKHAPAVTVAEFCPHGAHTFVEFDRNVLMLIVRGKAPVKFISKWWKGLEALKELKDGDI